MTASPLHGVRSYNFGVLGKAFMAGNGGAGFVPALKRYPGIGAGEWFKPTPRQWGAWMAYWSRLGYRTKAMRARGYCTTPAEWPHEFDATATIMGDHAAADDFAAGWRRRMGEAEAEGAGARKGISAAELVQEARRRPRSSTRPAFRPYPALAEAMANDGRAIGLLDGCTFDQMTHASKLLVSDGVEAVRRWLLDGHRVPKVRRGPTPPEHLNPAADGPTVDVSDFPPANATAAELKAWDERRKATEPDPEPREAAR